MPGGPYGEKTCIKTYIREAKMAFRSFQFEKKEMRFFRIIFIFRATHTYHSA